MRKRRRSCGKTWMMCYHSKGGRPVLIFRETILTLPVCVWCDQLSPQYSTWKLAPHAYNSFQNPVKFQWKPRWLVLPLCGRDSPPSPPQPWRPGQRPHCHHGLCPRWPFKPRLRRREISVKTCWTAWFCRRQSRNQKKTWWLHCTRLQADRMSPRHSWKNRKLLLVGWEDFWQHFFYFKPCFSFSQRFWSSGYCGYGDACIYRHISQQPTIEER